MRLFGASVSSRRTRNDDAMLQEVSPYRAHFAGLEEMKRTTMQRMMLHSPCWRRPEASHMLIDYYKALEDSSANPPAAKLKDWDGVVR